AYTASPSATVPRPGGRPAPLGVISMSHGARSAGEIGWPNCGVCARADADAAISIAAPRMKRSRIRIGRLPLVVDRPGLDGVEVVGAGQPALGDELRARGLHHAGVVGGAALQHRRRAVPLPRRAEARECLWQYRIAERCRRPALAAVGRDLNLPNAAVAGPSEPGNLVEARALEQMAGRG